MAVNENLIARCGWPFVPGIYRDRRKAFGGVCPGLYQFGAVLVSPAMVFQVHALFEDGEMLTTDCVRRPTPGLHERILVNRKGRAVVGRVVGVRQVRRVFPSGPVQAIDEVYFREGGEESGNVLFLSDYAGPRG